MTCALTKIKKFGFLCKSKGKTGFGLKFSLKPHFGQMFVQYLQEHLLHSTSEGRVAAGIMYPKTKKDESEKETKKPTVHFHGHPFF